MSNAKEKVNANNTKISAELIYLRNEIETDWFSFFEFETESEC